MCLPSELISVRGGLENTKLEAKDTKKSEAQAKDNSTEARPSRGQRPRTQRGSDLQKKGFRSKTPVKFGRSPKMGLRTKNSQILRKVQAFSKKKRSLLQNFVNFLEVSSVLQEENMSSKNFCKFSGVLQDETNLVMTLSHFQQVKK